MKDLRKAAMGLLAFLPAAIALMKATPVHASCPPQQYDYCGSIIHPCNAVYNYCCNSESFTCDQYCDSGTQLTCAFFCHDNYANC